MKSFETKFDSPGTPNGFSAAEFNDYINELENAVTGSGQTLTDADPNQLGKGVANYVSRGCIFNDVGSANAYTISTASNGMQLPSAVVDGLRVRFRAANSNTGASTVNVLAIGAKSLVRPNGLALAAGDVVAGAMQEVERDLTNDRWVLVSLSVAPGQATETVPGVAEIATQAETDAGTDDTRIITPLKMRGSLATEARPGVIELATQAEVDAGADAARAVTPATLAQRLATKTADAVFSATSSGEVADIFNNTSFTSYSKDTGANTVTWRFSFNALPNLLTSSMVAVASGVHVSYSLPTAINSNTMEISGTYDNNGVDAGGGDTISVILYVA